MSSGKKTTTGIKPTAHNTRRAHQQSAKNQDGSVRIIGGCWKRSKLPMPRLPGLRPTLDRVRTTLFDWLAPCLVGSHGWDMCAGTGALGFEAASRGAAFVLLTDTHPTLVANLQKQQTKWNAKQVEICHHDCTLGIPTGYGKFDVFWFDPPYEVFPSLLPAALRVASAAAKPRALIYLEHRDKNLSQVAQNHGLYPVKLGHAGQVHYGLFCWPANNT